jgi:hypothetical protein
MHGNIGEALDPSSLSRIIQVGRAHHYPQLAIIPAGYGHLFYAVTSGEYVPGADQGASAKVFVGSGRASAVELQANHERIFAVWYRRTTHDRRGHVRLLAIRYPGGCE